MGVRLAAARAEGEATDRGRGALLRFRTMALTTATLLIVLVFVGLPLQFGAGRPGMANVVGTIHGICYLVYLVTALQLTRRLGVPRWQIVLVLLAGTVPFAGLVAERKMTHRFEALRPGAAPAVAAEPLDRSLSARASRARRRWLSRRALLLHLEVAVVAPGCAAAGWWQATRALAGNGLSWFYSVEWPVFALIALAGWWYLIHEDPDVYRARKQGRPDGASAASVVAPLRPLTVAQTTARLATSLAVLVGIELATGVATVVLVPFSRANGWSPPKGLAIYLVHAVLGGPLAVGAALLLVLTRPAARLARLSGSIGAVGVALAGVGGLLTGAHALRLAGMGLMLLGTIVAVLGFVLPSLERLERSDAESTEGAADGAGAG